MAPLNTTRRVLEEALALARRSLPEEALGLLDRNLADAREAEDSHSVAVFAKNAAIISTNIGDLQRAVDYYAEAIQSQPGDAYLRIALADAYERLGQEQRAREALSKCHEIALMERDEDLLKILRERDFCSGPGV